MARTSLPPGFRFHPTDVELVMYYLKRKMMGKKLLFEAISELNIYKFCPWDLPDKCCLKSKDLEWYFFCPREKKYASGARANRATENGYWKATGKDRSVRYNNNIVAMTKTLVFHLGHAPEGKRTDWVMHEYRIEDKGLADAEIVQDYVLCKVFQKSGPGPKNGAQYGAPFNEEEWNDDGEICLEFSQANGLDSAFIVPPNNQKSSAVTSTTVPGNRTSWSFLQPGPSAASDVPPDMPDDDIVSLLAMFTEDSTSLPMGNEANFEEHMAGGNDIYDGLGDLGNFADLYEGGVNFSGLQESAYASAFLELNDLNTPLPCPAEACGSELLLADRSYPPYEYCANSEQFYYSGNFSGAVQNDSLNQPLALAESNCLRNHFEVLEGIMDGATHECSNSSLSVASCGPLGGSNGAAPTQTQGQQQRKSYSRLQQLLESIIARPASAASNYNSCRTGGSSIYVKAEVNPRVGGCTKDALYVEMGERILVCSCGCNLPRARLGKIVAIGSGGFACVNYMGNGTSKEGLERLARLHADRACSTSLPCDLITHFGV